MSLNFFDSIQKTAFEIVTNTFGYPATWTPSNSETELSAKVLYKDATEKQGLGDIDFNDCRYLMEYKAGDFPGLVEMVQNVDNTETVKIETTVGTVLEFFVKNIETKYDGKTIIAFLIQKQ